MNIRDLILQDKKRQIDKIDKVPKTYSDGSPVAEEDRLGFSVIYKSPEELNAMAEEAGQNIPMVGGTIAKVKGPVGREITNIATHMENGALAPLMKEFRKKGSQESVAIMDKAFESIANEPLKKKVELTEKLRQLILEKLKK